MKRMLSLLGTIALGATLTQAPPTQASSWQASGTGSLAPVSAGEVDVIESVTVTPHTLSSKLDLSWSVSSAAVVDRWMVQRAGTATSATWTTIAQLPGSARTYTDPDGFPGFTNHYRVVGMLKNWIGEPASGSGEAALAPASTPAQNTINGKLFTWEDGSTSFTREVPQWAIVAAEGEYNFVTAFYNDWNYIAVAKNGTVLTWQDPRNESLAGPAMTRLSVPSEVAAAGTRGEISKVTARGGVFGVITKHGRAMSWRPGSTDILERPSVVANAAVGTYRPGRYSSAVTTSGKMYTWQHGTSQLANTPWEIGPSTVISGDCDEDKCAALTLEGRVYTWTFGTEALHPIPAALSSGVVYLGPLAHNVAALKSDGSWVNWKIGNGNAFAQPAGLQNLNIRDGYCNEVRCAVNTADGKSYQWMVNNTSFIPTAAIVSSGVVAYGNNGVLLKSGNCLFNISPSGNGVRSPWNTTGSNYGRASDGSRYIRIIDDGANYIVVLKSEYDLPGSGTC